MVMTEKEEAIAKAQIALQVANDKLNKKSKLINDEIKATFLPIQANVKATHQVEYELLKEEREAAQEALDLLLDD